MVAATVEREEVGARSGDGEAVVDVRDLVKQYGTGKSAFTAVKGVSFQVRPGEVFGFLGPNGAGKTTTISTLCTLLKPTAGQVRINGYDIVHQANDVRRSIGLIFQDPTLDNQLTAQENLDFHAFAYDVPRDQARERGDALLKLLDLWERRDDQTKTFSGGMKRRLEIVRGLLHRPRVLFLDEPTQGLDPQTRSLIWQYLLGLRQSDGVTLFMTTHYMDEAEYCDRIAIIDHGEIVALDTPEKLKAMVGGDVVVVRTSDNERAIREIEQHWGRTPSTIGSELRLEVERGGKALGGSTVAMLQASLLLLVSPLVGVALTPLLVLQILGLLFLLAFALSSFGVAIASRLKSMEGFQVVMNFVMMPLLFLSGAFFPLSGLPGWLAMLTRLDPAGYAVDALRRVVLTSAGVPGEVANGLAFSGPSGDALPVLVEVLILALFSVPALMLAVRWFGQQE